MFTKMSMPKYMNISMPMTMPAPGSQDILKKVPQSVHNAYIQASIDYVSSKAEFGRAVAHLESINTKPNLSKEEIETVTMNLKEANQKFRLDKTIYEFSKNAFNKYLVF